MAKVFEIRALVEEVNETIKVGNNGFKKREVVAKIEGEYPDFYKFEFIKDKTELPDVLIPGTYATFFFNIQGRKVESRKEAGEFNYFTALQCWKVDIG